MRVQRMAEMIKKILFIWNCLSVSERMSAFAYAACLSIAAGFVIRTIIIWIS